MTFDSENIRVIQIYEPNTDSVFTYKSLKPVMVIGSGELADIKMQIPSLAYEHIRIDFESKKLIALGADVFIDDILVEIGTHKYFSNDSIVRIRHILFKFLIVADDTRETLQPYIEKLLVVSKIYPPVEFNYRLRHCNCSIVSDSNGDGSKEFFDTMAKEMKMNNGESELSDNYKRAIGEISELSPVFENSEPKKFKNSESCSEDKEKSFHSDQVSLSEKILEEAKQELESNLAVKNPNNETVESYIDRKIEDIKEDVQDLMGNDPNISVKRPQHSDLSKAAIDKDILDSAKNEINSRNSSETTEQKLEMAEKEIEICNHEIQDLKNNAIGSIKEDIKDDLKQAIHEEIKNALPGTLNECLVKPEVSSIIAEKIMNNIQANNTEISFIPQQIENEQTDHLKNQIEPIQSDENEHEKKEEAISSSPRKRLRSAPSSPKAKKIAKQKDTEVDSKGTKTSLKPSPKKSRSEAKIIKNKAESEKTQIPPSVEPSSESNKEVEDLKSESKMTSRKKSSKASEKSKEDEIISSQKSYTSTKKLRGQKNNPENNPDEEVQKDQPVKVTRRAASKAQTRSPMKEVNALDESSNPKTEANKSISADKKTKTKRTTRKASNKSK